MYTREQSERENQERIAQRERKMEEDRERLRLKARAFNNMQYYARTPQEKEYYRTIYMSL